ncbi:hypothetical protein [[Mycoplasma] collis]|uniref:hypothetical protein n=1 Tax=[Mycoplasma] collis TaxID=2127 RepID=UPI00051C31BE|nr:hypothetical protein [[Mycoplasma] collis]
MKINFHSIQTHNGNKEIIKFTSQLKLKKNKQTTFLEFLNPNNNFFIKIYFHKEKILIFHGENKIELILNKMISNKIKTPYGDFILLFLLNFFKKNENIFLIKYSSFYSNNEKAYDFELKLEIKN